MTFDPITHIFAQLDTLHEDVKTLHELTGRINREIGEIQSELTGRRHLIEADQEAMRRFDRDIAKLRSLIGGSGRRPSRSMGSPLHQILLSMSMLVGAIGFLWLVVTGHGDQAVAMLERVPR